MYKRRSIPTNDRLRRGENKLKGLPAVLYSSFILNFFTTFKRRVKRSLLSSDSQQMEVPSARTHTHNTSDKREEKCPSEEIEGDFLSLEGGGGRK